MKKNRSIIAAIVFVLATMLVACSKYKNGKENNGQDLTTIKILLIGESLNMDRVLDKYESELANDLGIKLSIEVMNTDEYMSQIEFKLNSMEKLDLVFNAPWMNLSEMVLEDKFMELDNYFCNPEYPGLQAAFSEEYLTQNMFMGNIYAIPVAEFSIDTKGIAYRKDLLRKYNLGFNSISTMEQLKEYYDAVLQNESEIAPIWLSQRGFYSMFQDEYVLNSNHIYEIPGWSSTNIPAYIVLNQDETKVEDVLFLGDSNRRFLSIEGDINSNFITMQMQKNVLWSKYHQKNSMMSYSGDTALVNNLAASIETSIGANGLVDKEMELRKIVPDAELDFFPYDSIYYEDVEENSIPTIMQAWNFVCIPSYSENADSTMRFLDWLYGSEEHLMEFSYGIEGVDWLRISDDTYQLIDNDDTYSFPGFSLSKNPNFVEYLDGVTEEQKQFLNLQNDKHPFYSSKLSGFMIDYTDIISQVSNIEDIYSEYYLALNHGEYGTEVLDKISELHDRVTEQGLETIRKNIISQAQAWLDTQNN